MKILHITTYLRGGAGKAAVRLHEALLDQGIDSHILYKFSDSRKVRNGHQFKSRKGYFTNTLGRLGVIDSVEKKNLAKKKGGVPFEYFSFCTTDIDITESHHCKSATIINLHWISDFFDLPLFFKKNTKPVIWSLSDMNSFSGGCHYSNGCSKYQADCAKCPQLEGTINNQNAAKNLSLKMNWFEARKFEVTIVPPANWLAGCSQSSKMFHNIKHQIIPHSSDEKIYAILDKAFCKEVFNLPDDKIIFMFASDNIASRRKGFNFLKKALAILNNPSIHLFIIGSRNELIQNELSELGNNYTFSDYIGDEKLLSIAYNAVSAVILPSIEDNLPLTLIDPFLCGVPSISFNVGGMQSHIIDGVNGLKAPELSGESLAETINIFINNMETYDRQKIRSLALNLYAKPVHAAQYISLYKEIVNC